MENHLKEQGRYTNQPGYMVEKIKNRTAILVKNNWDSVANDFLLPYQRRKREYRSLLLPPSPISVASSHHVRWCGLYHTQNEKLTKTSHHSRGEGGDNVFILNCCPSIFGQDCWSTKDVFHEGFELKVRYERWRQNCTAFEFLDGCPIRESAISLIILQTCC